jgi:hypothetical protein
VTLSISLLLYWRAGALPTLELARDNQRAVWSGLHVLLLGWLGLMLKQIAWYAKPLLLAAALALVLRKGVISALLAWLALIIAADTWRLFAQPIPADAGGVNQLLLPHLQIGYYCWLASIVSLLAGALILRLQQKSRPTL